MAEGVTLRDAMPGDAAAINAIYNHYVHHSTCTFQTVDATEAERVAWLEQHGDAHPAVVAECDGRVIAWGSLSRFHVRQAYGNTVEVSVYVDHERQGRGVGRRMLEHLIACARTIGHHALLSLIAADQPASLALHAKYGFVEVGRLREVGRKFGRWVDVAYFELIL